MRLFSTEQVSKYHPDKVCDQMSDAILDAYMAEDRGSRVAVECMVKNNHVFVCGEVTSEAKIDIPEVVNCVSRGLGYGNMDVKTVISYQSPDIAGGVGLGWNESIAAGDQGIMFGYATKETMTGLPFAFDLANRIIRTIEKDMEHNPGTTPFLGDAKTQVTVDLDMPQNMDAVKTIVISVCHRKDFPFEDLEEYVLRLLHLKGCYAPEADYIINPAGPWTLGGPLADCGLTGRKIVCDQYGGFMPVGGGAFSGKDPSKVDRTASYMAHEIARTAIDMFPSLDWCKVQLGYAIGVKDPVSVLVENSHNLPINEWVRRTFDLTPYGMVKYLHLLDGGFAQRAGGCHYRYPFKTDRSCTEEGK